MILKIISEPFLYTLDGVYQCWTCKHCVGKLDTTLYFKDSVDRSIGVDFCLPECEVMDLYMTDVNHIPCYSYESKF